MKHLLFILLTASIAFAHPVDDLVQDGGTVEPHHGLRLDEPDFFACRKHYWHERRVLFRTIERYNNCVGGVNALHSLKGWAPVQVFQALLDYSQNVPGEPIAQASQYPGQWGLDICQEHVNAAAQAIPVAELYEQACGLYLEYLKWLIK